MKVAAPILVVRGIILSKGVYPEGADRAEKHGLHKRSKFCLWMVLSMVQNEQ